uniref:NADH dehydrogenase subunit 3 n=1 Tax=Neosymplana vittatum TaxID=2886259 RepID=UPI001E778733|nr:NADH dehydrogenase subunit 3 [Neosymplana vittatum]UDL71973.1 NADH dehydrogenase subunit 3 [Neosymplana vittatum]
MKIFYSSISIFIITILVFILTMIISKKTKMSREKNSPFECGFSSLSSPRKSFSSHFFLIATIFLIFDVEISIIIPMFNMKMSIVKEWMISSTLIIMILMLGLMHEWKNGMLEWSK